MKTFFKMLTILIVALIFSNAQAQTANPRATYYYCGSHGMGWSVAGGERLTPQKAKVVRYIAVSRDLERKGFKLGMYVKVTSEHYPHLNGVWKIMDRMSSRMHNCIDFLLQNKGDRKKMKMPRHVKIELLTSSTK